MVSNDSYSWFPNLSAGPNKLAGGILAQKNKRAGPNKAVQGGKFGKINKHAIVEIQSLINVQGGILVQKNKRAGPNKAVQGGKLGKINKRTIVCIRAHQ